jgi:predicted MFS family arabinose efflux permease
MTDPAGAPPASVRNGNFITGLGIAQIVSWGSLYYSFPLIAEPMGVELGMSKPAIYGAATLGMLVAGGASYAVGVAIDRGRGRTVMAAGSVLGGLLLLAWSAISSPWHFYPILAGIGLAQALTLYEPAFGVVNRRFGADARRGITALTLWGGFASTVFVPLIGWLLGWVGWRGALWVLAGFNLTVCVGLYWVMIDPAADRPQQAHPSGGVGLAGWSAVRWVSRQPAFWALLCAFTIYYGLFGGLAFHMYPLLLERGLDPGRVVAAIAIIGPAQVAGRIAIWYLARNRSMRVIGLWAAAALPAALSLLILGPAGFGAVAVFAAIYGAANGVMTIVRGMVVPELLTREAYGTISGTITMPANAARAVAPFAMALLWTVSSSYDSVLILAALAGGLVVACFWLAGLRPTGAPAAAESTSP